MKSIALILTLAISGIAVSSVFTPASASKMDGKGYGHSDKVQHQGAKARKAAKHAQ